MWMFDPSIVRNHLYLPIQCIYTNTIAYCWAIIIYKAWATLLHIHIWMNECTNTVKLKIDQSKAISRDQQKFSYISWLIDFTQPPQKKNIYNFPIAWLCLFRSLSLCWAFLVVFAHFYEPHMDTRIRSNTHRTANFRIACFEAVWIFFCCSTWNGHLIKFSFMSLWNISNLAIVVVGMTKCVIKWPPIASTDSP